MGGKKLLLAGLVVLLFAGMVFSANASKTETVAKKAATILGWPDATTTPKDVPGTSYLISSDGKGDDSEIRGYVSEMNPAEMAYASYILELFGMPRASYQGRDAHVFKAGKDCNPKGLTKALNEMFVGWFEGIFGPSDDPDKNCVTYHGTIVWTCKSYMFMATDETDEGGNEESVAAAIYTAAQEEGLCDYGDSLVILAQTTDTPGAKTVADFAKISQRTNEYYGKNSYGKEIFTFSFMDADGSKGKKDWYEVGASQAGMSHQAYVEAAVKKAFGGTSMPDDLHFKRIIVVYSGSSKQADETNGVLQTADQWEDSNYAIEVAAQGRTAKIYSTDLILVAENDEMGLWAHEIGHSIYSKYPVYDKYNHVADRYNYQDAWGQHGNIGNWGLMGSGNWWGTPLATNPVQMSSFTKESAGWLSYSDMKLNESYTATALESKKLGDSTYRLDDPQSNDARFFYIVEARDASGVYSAPESGTVIYKVSYDVPNKHYVVNIINPQTGPTEKNDTTIYAYPFGRATLRGAGAPDGATIYRNVPANFKVTLESETAAPYTSTFKVEEYRPANLVGAKMDPIAPAAMPGGAVITANTLGPLPDLDLHAYDGQGGHVGLNYQTGEYENTISGAIGSGDLRGDEEWIYVPEGTNVRFEVSSYKTQQFLARNPSASPVQLQFAGKLAKIDSQGRQLEADGGISPVAAGANVQMKGPKDPSLTYNEVKNPGIGTNSVCPFFLVLALFVGCAAFLARGRF